MKKVLVTLSSMLVVIGAYAQGTVSFASRYNVGQPGGYDAPVYIGAIGGLKAEGAAFMAQLYAGPTDTSLAAIGAAVPFRTGTAAGYWTTDTRTIPGIAGGADAKVQIRAWAASAGATFEAAQAAGANNVGQSSILTVKLGNESVGGGPPSLPANLTGLTSFAIGNVPEPSILALGALGGLALLLRRRK